MKFVAPPKFKEDEETMETICSMRLYCNKFVGRNNPDSCPFAIGFRFTEGKWHISDDYALKRMVHTGHSISRTMEE